MKRVISVFLVMIMLLSSFSILSYAHSTNVIDTYNEVLVEIRECMLNRERNISFRYEGNTTLEEIKMEDVFALDYTGTLHARADGGDYLRLNIASYTEPVVSKDGIVSLTVSYYTTREQEEMLKNAIYEKNAGLDKTKLVGKSTDKIIETIFDFICDNVSYDEEHYFDDSYTLKHTAYAAFFNKKAVCQGYALLFQLMAKEVGIDSRIVLGHKNDENHAWNIVKIDNMWYHIDPTYGAGFEDRTAYFLKASLPNTEISFEEGFTSSDIQSYDFSVSDYTEPEHDYVMTSITEATCTDDGRTVFTCSDCGKKRTVTHTKALGHVFDGSADEQCNVCGFNRPGWTFDEETGALVFSGSGSTKDCDLWDEFESEVKSIDMGDGSIVINDYSFSEMENLETIDLGNVTSIGADAFRNCKSLKTLNIPASLTGMFTALPFKGCESLEMFTSSNSKLTADEDGVLWFGDVLFAYPPGNPREEYYLRDRGIAAIAKYAFISANNLKTISFEAGKPGDTSSISGVNLSTQYVKFSNGKGGVNEVDTNIIDMCENLEKVILTNHLNINGGYIYSCQNLKEVYIGYGTSKLGSNPFIYCEKLEKIVVDEKNPYLHSDEIGALYSDDSLITYPGGCENKTYTTPAYISNIGKNAFHACNNLETIEFSENIESLTNQSICQCASIKKLLFRNSEANITFNPITILLEFDHPIEFYGFKGSTAEALVERNNAGSPIIEYIFREFCPACQGADATESAAVKPTCYSVGYTKGLKCNNCSSYYYGHEEIAVVAHADEDIDAYCDFCGISVMMDDRGKLGADIFWRVFDNGVLRLYGSGAVFSDIPSPWSEYEDDFDTVYSEGVVEGLPDSYFAGCDNIKYVFIPEGMTSVESVGECIAFSESAGTISFRNLSEGAMHFDIYDILNAASMFSTTYGKIRGLNFNELVFERAEDGLPVTYNILRNGKRISENRYTLEDNKVLKNVSMSVSNYSFDEYLFADPDSFKKSVYLVMKSADLLPDEMKDTAEIYTCETLLHFVDEPVTPDKPVTPDEPKKESFMDKFMGFINSIMNVFRKILKIFSR